MKTDQILHQCVLPCKSGGFSKAVMSAEKLKFSCTFYKRKYVLFTERKCEKQCMCDCVLFCSYLQWESPSNCISQQKFLIFGILNLNRLVVDAFVTKASLVGWLHMFPTLCHPTLLIINLTRLLFKTLHQALVYNWVPVYLLLWRKRFVWKTFSKSSADNCPGFSVI